MRRLSVISQLVIQFPNQIQPGQFDGAPLVMVSSMIVKADTNTNAYPPASHMEPAAPEDINDEVLGLLQVQMERIGLTVSRIQPVAPPAPETQPDLNHGNGDAALESLKS